MADLHTTLQAYQEFLAADNAWSENLRTAFGKHGLSLRYTDAAKTHPLCAASYAEFVRARECWNHVVAAEHQHAHALTAKEN